MSASQSVMLILGTRLKSAFPRAFQDEAAGRGNLLTIGMEA